MRSSSLIINPPTSHVSIDLAHAALLQGVILSMKPARVLELGFGEGYTSRVISDALEWNGTGDLTIVDNWCDWGGQRPNQSQVQSDRVAVVTADERDFVRSAPTDRYDILVSDADHQRSHFWLSDHLRIVKPGGVLFFHDVGKGTDFRNLQGIPAMLRSFGIPHKLFESSTRADERCERGWLVAFKPRRIA